MQQIGPRSRRERKKRYLAKSLRYIPRWPSKDAASTIQLSTIGKQERMVVESTFVGSTAVSHRRTTNSPRSTFYGGRETEQPLEQTRLSLPSASPDEIITPSPR